MFVREIKVKNYSIHRDTSVKFSPITVFVGPNGGGKSAFFDALLNFSMISRGNLRQAFNRYPFSFGATLHRGAGNVARIFFRVEMTESNGSSETLMYEIDYNQTGHNDDLATFTIFN